MTPKKAGDKRPAPARLSRASRLLGGAVRAALPFPPPGEAWRDKKQEGRDRGKRRK